MCVVGILDNIHNVQSSNGIGRSEDHPPSEHGFACINCLGLLFPFLLGIRMILGQIQFRHSLTSKLAIFTVNLAISPFLWLN